MRNQCDPAPSIRKSLEEGPPELGFEGKTEVSQAVKEEKSLSGRRDQVHSLAGLGENNQEGRKIMS